MVWLSRLKMCIEPVAGLERCRKSLSSNQFIERYYAAGENFHTLNPRKLGRGGREKTHPWGAFLGGMGKKVWARSMQRAWLARQEVSSLYHALLFVTDGILADISDNL